MPKAIKPKKEAGLYKLAFDHARDSILVLELRDEGAPLIVDANLAALKLHGFKRAELLGRPVTLLGARRSAAAGSASEQAFEISQRRRDGRRISTEVTASNVRAGGKLYGILIERDVTLRSERAERERVIAGRIMQAREEAKKKLAAAVHDALGALNVGLSAEFLLLEDALRAGKKTSAAAALSRARQALRETSAGLKRACVESWPAGLAVAGLEGALEDLLAAFSKRSGIKVSSKISLPPGAARGREPAAIIVYRLAQEALANTERHSGARALEFTLSAAGGWLELELRDDGRGFSMGAAGTSNCLGLKIMADAAAAAGGYLSVYSAPGKGTRIKARLPLSAGRKKRRAR